MKLLFDQAIISLAGQNYAIQYKKSRMLKPRVMKSEGKLEVYLGETSALSHNDVLLDWIKIYAASYISERCKTLAQKFGFSFNKLVIRDQRSRWGSCSSKGNLNFNFRLILTPPQTIDYVIIHELCHLKEMNHSHKFWSLVEQCMPEYKVWEKWLKVEGKGLF